MHKSLFPIALDLARCPDKKILEVFGCELSKAKSIKGVYRYKK